MFGLNQPVILHLLDLPRAIEGLKGVEMEIDDCAYPLVAGVVATADVELGFKDVDVAILLGGFPRLQGMTRADLLLKNKDIFFGQGKALADYSKPDCKVMVIANPANTNCILAYESMKAAGGSIPAENFTCMMRLDHNRASSQVAQKLGVGVTQISNIAIWGNHSADQFPDCTHATVGGKSVEKELGEGGQQWLEQTFRPTVQGRGAAVIKQRGKSSACSAANAAKDHIRDWVLGTKEGEWVSMGVISDGKSYGVPADIVFSFPCKCTGGKWAIVPDLKLADATVAALLLNAEKLTQEKATAMGK